MKPNKLLNVTETVDARFYLPSTNLNDLLVSFWNITYTHGYLLL